MSRQIQEAYIVAATRTPVGKAPRGMLHQVRPDDMLAHVIKSLLAQKPGLPADAVQDCVVGGTMPEAEQGLNMARSAALLAGLPYKCRVSPSTVFAHLCDGIHQNTRHCVGATRR